MLKYKHIILYLIIKICDKMSERNIIVENLNQTYIEDVEVEIVERKGIGHPDSISDGLAQAVSNALCDMYDEEVGVVLHHNTDEVQITAGASIAAL